MRFSLERQILMEQAQLENHPIYKMFLEMKKGIRTNLYQGNFNHEGAIKSVERYIQIAENMQSTLFLGQVYDLLAFIESEVEHYQVADGYYRKAIELYTQEDNPEQLSIAYCALGEVHRRIGNFNDAVECFHQSMSFAQSIDYTRLIIYNYCNEGQLWLTQGDLDKAVSLLQNGLNLVHNAAWDTEYRHRIMPEILSSLGEAYARMGQNEIAWRQSERALELARKENQVQQIAQAYQTMALIALHEDMTDAVENYIEESRIHWQKANAKANLGHLALLEAEYWKKQQDTPRVMECYATAIDYFKAAHLLQEVENVRSLLNEIT